MTTANKITMARILMIPIFVMMAIYYGRGVEHGTPQAWQRWLAVTIFALAAASDGVDGYIARRYNQRSQLGVILDPIADKGLLIAGIITLSFSSWGYEFPVWFPVLVIARDIIVVTGAIAVRMFSGRLRVRASWQGKCATALQMIAVVLVMSQWNEVLFIVLPETHRWAVTSLDLSIWLAGIFTAISGVGYVMEGIRQLHERGQGDPARHDQSATDAVLRDEEAAPLSVAEKVSKERSAATHRGPT